MDPFVLLLTGSRALPRPAIVGEHLFDLTARLGDRPLVVRHGDCPGDTSADQLAAEFIRLNGEVCRITEDPMPADWDHCTPDCPNDGGRHRRRKKPGDTAHPGRLDTYCPGAGPRRNAAMVAKEPRPDRGLAFPHGASYGTRGCIRLAKQAGIHVEVIET